VTDANLTERYIRWEKDPYSGFYALVGSGTTHKYLLYFDGRFPFIHQNFIHMNLGTSYTRYRGQEITDVINRPTGDQLKARLQYPAQVGTDTYIDSAIDFHTLSYNPNPRTRTEETQFPDQYTTYSYRYSGLSMLENSFVIGLIATLIAYLIGLPLGILMARHKDGLADKIGNMYIIFIMAVPSLAYIFMFRAIGKSIGLPTTFDVDNLTAAMYVLPIASLALPSIGGFMKWVRRYMIDQMNSDYVKFARSGGLTEREVFSKHILKNAIIPITHGIPGAILGAVVGGIITESVYSVPGTGGMLVKAINFYDNGSVIGLTLFYTMLSVISLILGDIVMALVDPRISYTSKGR
jgi:oligopeptide transport system permease protein